MNLSLGFFDIDGTLIRRNRRDGLTVKSRSFNYAIEKVFGLKDVDYTALLGRRIFGLTDKKIMKLCISHYGLTDSDFESREKELFAEAEEYFREHRMESGIPDYVPLPGIVDFLEFLAGEGVRLGLVTGNIEMHSRWKLADCGFDGFFTTGAYGEDAESRREILSIALERNSDTPISQTCHFGDSPLDLDAARWCGIKGVAICDTGGGTHTREELQTAGYGLVINSWMDREIIRDYLG